MNKNEFITRFSLSKLSISPQTLQLKGLQPHAKKPAAVLMLFSACPSTNKLSLILTKRAMHLRHHAGQIAFPGGKVEQSDSSIINAALRETEEEIGISPADVSILGCLPTHDTVSGFIVTPVIGVLNYDKPTSYRIDENEVDDVIEVPLSYFINRFKNTLSNNQKVEVYHHGIKRNVYVMPYEGHTIWGATAAMLNDLISHIT